ncbi:hypothetical protein HGM15179_022274, partial [Zosterops borbonicus]
ALIVKLKDPDPDPNPGVINNVLATIGELAQVSGLEMRKWVDELFIIIMDMLQDSSLLAKRQVRVYNCTKFDSCCDKGCNEIPTHPIIAAKVNL